MKWFRIGNSGQSMGKRCQWDVCRIWRSSDMYSEEKKMLSTEDKGAAAEETCYWIDKLGEGK